MFLALSVFWVVRDVRRPAPRQVAAWSRTNTIRLGSLIALLPIQFVLLRFGAAHGTTDLIGVVLVIAQWMLLADAFKQRGAPAGD